MQAKDEAASHISHLCIAQCISLVLVLPDLYLDGVVLVGSGGNSQLAVLLDKPSPATAKAASSCCVELVLELIHGAKGLVDGCLKAT